MKKLLTAIAVSTSLFALSASAEETTVKVTSFYYTTPNNNMNYRDYTAEICGVVVGKVQPTHRIAVTVDPGNKPATYVVLPGEAGEWCALVNSYTGRADVKLLGEPHAAVPAVAR